jgi:hypothetical protein
VLAGGRIAGSAPKNTIDRHWLGERVFAVTQEVAT